MTDDTDRLVGCVAVPIWRPAGPFASWTAGAPTTPSQAHQQAWKFKRDDLSRIVAVVGGGRTELIGTNGMTLKDLEALLGARGFSGLTAWRVNDGWQVSLKTASGGFAVGIAPSIEAGVHAALATQGLSVLAADEGVFG